MPTDIFKILVQLSSVMISNRICGLITPKDCVITSYSIHYTKLYEEKQETERQKTLQRELEWINMSPKGRRAKAKARIKSYETLLSQERDKQTKDLEIYIPPGPRLGNLVIEAEKA